MRRSTFTLFVMAGLTTVSQASPPPVIPPQIVETRTIDLTQTVTLHDVPAGAQQIDLWVPVPGDTAWQRVLDREVLAAPGDWQVVRQEQTRGEFIHVQVQRPASATISVVVRCVVERQGVAFPIDDTVATPALKQSFFLESLDLQSPLMSVDDRIRRLADEACGDERDPARQAVMLSKAVAAKADHYSKDPTKPTCGRGSAQDCLDQGGGCCTDLHSLFIAMARSRGIPARMQYGYRTLDAKAGAEFDPGYRCWVEYFIPGAGWVPTDVVAADNDESENPHRWASLAASKVWLWEGRSFELTPRSQGGPVHTMICGWAEIDGQAVDVLPAADGTPSKLRRTVKFDVIARQKQDDQARLPQ